MTNSKYHLVCHFVGGYGQTADVNQYFDTMSEAQSMSDSKGRAYQGWTGSCSIIQEDYAEPQPTNVNPTDTPTDLINTHTGEKVSILPVDNPSNLQKVDKPIPATGTSTDNSQSTPQSVSTGLLLLGAALLGFLIFKKR